MSFDSDDLWGIFRLGVMLATAINMVVTFRNRPNAPPKSWMIRWAISGLLAAGIGLIMLVFWLVGRGH